MYYIDPHPSRFCPIPVIVEHRDRRVVGPDHATRVDLGPHPQHQRLHQCRNRRESTALRAASEVGPPLRDRITSIR